MSAEEKLSGQERSSPLGGPRGLEQKEDAADSLRKAKVAATAFDREPNYDARNIRFVSAAEAATAYDDMGSTAMDVIDTILADSDEPMLLTRWMRIQNEE